MPSPTSTLVTLRPDLASSLEEFPLMMDRASFVGHRIMPVIDTAVASGNFGIIPLEQLLQNPEVDRAPAGTYKRGSWTFEAATFATKEKGREEPIDENESRIYANYFDAEMISTARAQDAVLRAAEKRIADAVTNTASIANAAASVPWDNQGSGVAETDVEVAVQAFYDATGLWPNLLVMSRKTFRNVRRQDSIIDASKAQGFMDVRKGNVTTQALEAVFDLQVAVAGASQNTADAGQTAVVGQLWPVDKALIARVGMTNDIREPCLGNTIHYTGDGSMVDGRVEMYEEPQSRSDIVRVRHQVDEKIKYLACARLITGLTT